MKLIHVKSKYAEELIEMTLRNEMSLRVSGLDSTEFKRFELAGDEDEYVATNAMAKAMYENAKLLEEFYGEKVITKYCWAMFESAVHNRNKDAFEACQRQFGNITNLTNPFVFKDYCWSIDSDWKRLHCHHAFVVSPGWPFESEDDVRDMVVHNKDYRDMVINDSIGVYPYRALFE